MKKIRVDFAELQKAAEDTEREAFDYFLDRQTGEIIILSVEIIALAQEILAKSYDEDNGDFEDVELDEIPEIPEWMEDEIELALDVFMQDQDCYERIPERRQADAYSAMKAFAETLEDRQLGAALLHALDGNGSFRKFKNLLGPHPKERKLWYGFNAKAVRKEIDEWLASLGIKADIP